MISHKFRYMVAAALCVAMLASCNGGGIKTSSGAVTGSDAASQTVSGTQSGGTSSTGDTTTTTDSSSPFGPTQSETSSQGGLRPPSSSPSVGVQTPSGSTGSTGSAGSTGGAVETLRFSTDVWKAVPLVSSAIKSTGYSGSEGGQWMNYAIFDSVDGRLALAGTDVGRTWRSTDGGKTWEPASIGLNNRGSVGVAIDSNNTNNVLLISGSGTGSGIYRSTDAGVTWNCSAEMYMSRSHDYRNMLAFDTTTGNKYSGSTTAYWVTATESASDIKQYGLTLGVYKSTDGGKTWSFCAGSEHLAGGWIEVDVKGRIYVATKTGIYRSTNGAKSWSRILTGAVNSLEVIRTSGYENYLYALDNSHFYVSKDAGNSFSILSNMTAGSKVKYTNLSVSPADPNYMVMQNDTLTDFKDYTLTSYYSHNGGKTWSKSTFDFSNGFLPVNPRQRLGSFHPTNRNVAITLGCDYIMRSTDGGKSYQVSSSGYNAIFATDISINVNNPNLIAISAQDYNGAFSTDGGKTWKYVSWSGKGWGGHTYGVYPISDKVIAVCHSTEWRASANAKKELYITFDGGKTVKKTGHKVTGELFGCGAKGNNNIAFIGEWRTTDGGNTWSVMNGCTGVLSLHYETGWLFGLNGDDIVMSKDNGATWTTLLSQGECRVNGIAYNHVSGKVFIAYWSGELRSIQLNASRTAMTGKPVTVLGSQYYVTCVAVDPTNNDVMYVTCYTNRDHKMHNTWRSLDGGKTWTGLSRQAGDGRTGPDGGNDGSICIVHPTTHELYTISHCNGIWKIAPPPQ